MPAHPSDYCPHPGCTAGPFRQVRSHHNSSNAGHAPDSSCAICRSNEAVANPPALLRSVREGADRRRPNAPDRRFTARRSGEVAVLLTEQAIVSWAVAWATDEEGKGANAAGLRAAVERLLAIRPQAETGSSQMGPMLWILATLAAPFAVWGQGWTCAAACWVVALAGLAALWLCWPFETYEEHLYGDCQRCNRLPIDCPTLRRIALREERQLVRRASRHAAGPARLGHPSDD